MEDIIKQLGLEHLSNEERASVITQLTESLLKRLILRVYDRLGEQDQKEFELLAEQGNTEKINDFLGQKIPDFLEIRDEEISGLVEEMKDFMAAAKKQ